MITIIIQGKDSTGPATQSAQENIRGLGGAAEAEGGRIRSFFSGIGPVVAGAGVAAAGALVAAAGAGLSMNNSMEQASARIQAFTKDSAATAEILDMVRERAAMTPFAFNEMANAAAALLPSARQAGIGLEELIAQAEILAASNPAEGLEGAAFALKEAVSGDFTSIIERFNLPRQRLNELKEQGVPALEAVQIAMQELGLDADLVTGLAGTMEGRWSTLMDTFQNLAAQVTQPIFDTVSASLGNFQGILDANAPMIQAFAELLAGQVGDAIAFIQALIPQLIAQWESFSPALANAGGAFATVQGIVTSVMDGIMAIVSAVLPLISAFWEENGASILATAQTAWNGVVTIVQTVAQILGAVLSAIGGFIAAHGDEIVAVLSNTWNVISAVVTTAIELIQGVLQAVLQLIQGDFEGAWTTIEGTAAGFVTSLIGIIEGAATLLGSAIDLGIAAIQDAWNAFTRGSGSLGNDLIDGIVAGISRGVGALKSAITSAAQAALTAAKEALGISSPSRVFAAAVGLPIAQGMAAGIAQGAPLVASAGMALAGASVGGAQSYQTVYNVDARGSTMSAAQWQATINRTNNATANDAALRRRMG